jgi:hypothetical protein
MDFSIRAKKSIVGNEGNGGGEIWPVIKRKFAGELNELSHANFGTTRLPKRTQSSKHNRNKVVQNFTHFFAKK